MVSSWELVQLERVGEKKRHPNGNKVNKLSFGKKSRGFVLKRRYEHCRLSFLTENVFEINVVTFRFEINGRILTKMEARKFIILKKKSCERNWSQT